MPLGEVAYRRLRADIISCRLAPGQRLTERGLALETGLGMSPIREALTRLDHDGLVITLPRKGYKVAPLTVKSVDDVFTLWRIVGPEIARLGVQNATDAQFARIVDRFASLYDTKLRAASAAEEAMRRLEVSAEVFGLLAEATTNEYLVGLYRRIIGDMWRAWQLIYEHELSETSDVAEEHPILEILDRRDADAAAADARRYIGLSHERILKILSRWPSVLDTEVLPVARPAPPPR
jgi:DNA-binding GntR family transcriptional regulator